MKTEYFFLQKYLGWVEKKIESCEHKKENCSRSKFEEILEEIRVLRDIENFLWKKLNWGEKWNTYLFTDCRWLEL